MLIQSKSGVELLTCGNQARVDTSYQVHQGTHQYCAASRTTRHEEGHRLGVPRTERIRIYRQQGMLGGREKLRLTCGSLNETVC